MAYWSPSALGALAQSESSGQASLVHYPNNVAWGGSSTSGSSASGLYGFLTGTWQTYAPQAGVDISQYPYAYTAPASVQTQVAAITPISNWTCPGCNSTASALAQNPSNVLSSPSGNIQSDFGLGDPNLTQLNDPAYLTGMPVYGDTTASDTTGLPYGGTSGEMGAIYGTTANGLQNEGYYGGALHVNVTPPNTTATSQVLAGGGSPAGSLTNTGVIGSAGSLFGAGTGQNVQVGLQPSTVTDIGKWISQPITAFEQWAASMAEQGINWFERGFLIFLAIVIIFVALWRLSGERGSGGTTRIVPIPA